MIEFPETLRKKLDKLNALAESNPDELSIDQVADFLGTTSDRVRNAIFSTNCPFGFGWRIVEGGNRVFFIPTLTFYIWYTQGAIFKQ